MSGGILALIQRAQHPHLTTCLRICRCRHHHRFQTTRSPPTTRLHNRTCTRRSIPVLGYHTLRRQSNHRRHISTMDIPIRDLHRDQGMGLLSEVSFRLARPSVNVKSTIFPMDCCTVFGHSFVLVFFFSFSVCSHTSALLPIRSCTANRHHHSLPVLKTSTCGICLLTCAERSLTDSCSLLV